MVFRLTGDDTQIYLTKDSWFQNHILHRAEVRFLPGRLKYEVNGQAGEAAPFPSMIVVMRTGER